LARKSKDETEFRERSRPWRGTVSVADVKQYGGVATWLVRAGGSRAVGRPVVALHQRFMDGPDRAGPEIAAPFQKAGKGFLSRLYRFHVLSVALNLE